MPNGPLTWTRYSRASTSRHTAGNRRAQTFFVDGDYLLYRDLLAQAASKAGAQVWVYCLTPNHAHLIVMPADGDGLRRTLADAHRRYTAYINAWLRMTGH